LEAAPAFFFGLALASSLEQAVPGAVQGWLDELKGAEMTLGGRSDDRNIELVVTDHLMPGMSRFDLSP